MRFVETPEEFETWCEANGYSKDDLAEILGVTRQTIYNWTHKKTDLPQGITLSAATKLDLERHNKKYDKIPRMLSFALFAIESMAPQNVFGGRRLRKRTKRR